MATTTPVKMNNKESRLDDNKLGGSNSSSNSSDSNNNSSNNNSNSNNNNNSKSQGAEKTKTSFSSSAAASREVIQKLKALYSEQIRDIEAQCLFDKFGHAPLLDSELNSKPTVMFLGQYSVGKTTFIIKLLGRDELEGYGSTICEVSPHPTTDKFIAIVHGNKDDERVIPGNTATGVGDLPFQGLSSFGSQFLSKFATSVVNSPILEDINLIDTPGVLSGEKQWSRGYDFSAVTRWFAKRCDLIFLMFDPSKLDISDELKEVIQQLQPYEEKVRCVLNKADSLDTEQLIHVYGALMWSMARIFKGAEVTKVFLGSFHDKPLVRNDHEELFRKDQERLEQQLRSLPEACSMRKVNDLIRRVRALIVHICILSHLRSKMPLLFSRESARREMINKLDVIFEEVQVQKGLAAGDFPPLAEFKEYLEAQPDFSLFPDSKTADRLCSQLEHIMNENFSDITDHISHIVRRSNKNVESLPPSTPIRSRSGDSSLLPPMFISDKNRHRTHSSNSSSSSSSKSSSSSSKSSAFVIISFFIAIVAIAMGVLFNINRPLFDTIVNRAQTIVDSIKGSK